VLVVERVEEGDEDANEFGGRWGAVRGEGRRVVFG
jgi:hypothetical protein